MQPRDKKQANRKYGDTIEQSISDKCLGCVAHFWVFQSLRAHLSPLAYDVFVFRSLCTNNICWQRLSWRRVWFDEQAVVNCTKQDHIEYRQRKHVSDAKVNKLHLHGVTWQAEGRVKHQRGRKFDTTINWHFLSPRPVRNRSQENILGLGHAIRNEY